MYEILEQGLPLPNLWARAELAQSNLCKDLK